MALWQTQFFIVKENNSTIEKRNKEEILFWGNTPLDGASLLKISKLLYREKSWTDEIVQYGKEDENCLELFYDGNILVDISCRIDIRCVTNELLKEIISFMVVNKAKIFKNNVFYDPTLENLVFIIKSSQAYKFCENPCRFLDQMNNT